MLQSYEEIGKKMSHKVKKVKIIFFELNVFVNLCQYLWTFWEFLMLPDEIKIWEIQHK